jgi:hypothetical protein
MDNQLGSSNAFDYLEMRSICVPMSISKSVLGEHLNLLKLDPIHQLLSLNQDEFSKAEALLSF